MQNLFEVLGQDFVAIVANIGILACLGWLSSFLNLLSIDDVPRHLPRKALWVGVTYGLAAAALMFAPITLVPGIFGDGRAAPLILSGMLGGPVGGAVAAIIAAFTRFLHGGAGMLSGVLYIFAVTGFGVLWRVYRIRRDRETRGWEFAAIGLGATVLALPVVLVLPEQFWVRAATEVWPRMTVISGVGVAILGTLLIRELQIKRLILSLHEKHRDAETARAHAESAEKAKTLFLANMSHELRTPMNAILGFSDLLSNALSNFPNPLERAQKYGVLIHTSAEHLLALLDDLLDFSKIEAGHAVLAPLKVTVDDAWHTKLDELALTARGHRVSLSRDPQTASLQVFVDPKAFRQCLTNLSSNAVKYTPSGGSIKAGVLRNGETVTFWIEDTGGGIPEELLDVAQRPFERITDHLKTDDPGGTGLGLSITRSLVEKMGGTLTLRNTYEDGARTGLVAEIRLPLTTAVPAVPFANTPGEVSSRESAEPQAANASSSTAAAY